MMLSDLTTPPPATKISQLSFPAAHVLLVTLNRPEQLNCINAAGHAELQEVWTWFDHEPALRVGIVTGAGRAFCAGADLKEWLDNVRQSNAASAHLDSVPGVFAGLSMRVGRKPVIAAVNGLYLGGGLEMVVNCDLILAASDAMFGLPEAKLGVAAMAGVLPRLPKIIGHQRAMEMALLGRSYDANTMLQWGLVNCVVPKAAEGGVVAESIKWAQEMARCSPDSLIVSREAVRLGAEPISANEATLSLDQGLWQQLLQGENLHEGLQAFSEKRQPQWHPSKL